MDKGMKKDVLKSQDIEWLRSQLLATLMILDASRTQVSIYNRRAIRLRKGRNWLLATYHEQRREMQAVCDVVVERCEGLEVVACGSVDCEVRDYCRIRKY